MENNEQLRLIKVMGFWEKISSIQHEIKSLIKDEVNKFQNYKYFDEAQILKHLKPLLEKYRLAMVISDDETQPFQHEREGTNHFIKYLKLMTLNNIDNNNEQRFFRFWACGNNTDLAKAKGSAETYAMKYILSKFWLIRVIDENDPELKENTLSSGETKENVKGKYGLTELEHKQVNQALEKHNLKETEKAKQEREWIKTKIILKEDENKELWWYCKECNFKLIRDYSEIKTNEIIEKYKKHGEHEEKDKTEWI